MESNPIVFLSHFRHHALRFIFGALADMSLFKLMPQRASAATVENRSLSGAPVRNTAISAAIPSKALKSLRRPSHIRFSLLQAIKKRPVGSIKKAGFGKLIPLSCLKMPM